jgi:PAS domain S-box-containing protein
VGHLFKLLCYFYLYRMVFITAIREPYERLAATELALRESETFANRIIETAPDAILIADERGRIVRVNDYAEQLFGYAKDALIGKPVETLLPERLRLDHARHRSIYMGNPVVRPMVRGLAGREVTGRRLDGSEFPVEAGLGPVQAGEGDNVIVVLRDITLRKQAEQALSRLNAELEQRVESRTAELQRANRELETFSYSVAHDLRSPLRAIIGFSSLLQEDAQPAQPGESRDLLARIEHSAQRMATQIDALLALSRVSRTAINPQTVDLTAVAKKVVCDLRQIEPERAVEVLIEEGLVCQADPALIHSVMQNLVGNAWKYTGRAAAPSIRIGRQAKDGRELFFVADNGAGFDMQYANRLFEPFQRLHTQEEFTGIGVGLATVRRIIERHGGEIHAHAQLGAGACFYFSLASQAAAAPSAAPP